LAPEKGRKKGVRTGGPGAGDRSLLGRKTPVFSANLKAGYSLIDSTQYFRRRHIDIANDRGHMVADDIKSTKGKGSDTSKSARFTAIPGEEKLFPPSGKQAWQQLPFGRFQRRVDRLAFYRGDKSRPTVLGHLDILGDSTRAGARYDAVWGNLFQNPSDFVALVYQGV
jgi:hypothetical protein